MVGNHGCKDDRRLVIYLVEADGWCPWWMLVMAIMVAAGEGRAVIKKVILVVYCGDVHQRCQVMTRSGRRSPECWWALYSTTTTRVPGLLSWCYLGRGKIVLRFEIIDYHGLSLRENLRYGFEGN